MVANVRESINQGVTANTGPEIAEAIRAFANGPNRMNQANKDAMLTAARNFENMSPEQLQATLDTRGRNGRTVEQLITSDNPLDQAAGMLTMTRQAAHGAPDQNQNRGVGGSQPQPSQPRVGFPNPGQDYMQALRDGDPSRAGASLEALAQQQAQMAQASRNPRLAETARINHAAAQRLSGPHGQEELNAALNHPLDRNGTTVGQMLNSNNPNTQNLVGAYVANHAAHANQYANNNIRGLQNAARMESALGGGVQVAGMNGQHGVNGGHNAAHVGAPAGVGGNQPGGRDTGIT